MNDRRRPGSSGGPRAASPAVAVGVAIVAAILGFFILKQFDGGSDSAKPGAGSQTDSNDTSPAGTDVPATNADGSPVVVDVVTTPVATLPPAWTSYTVVVANASKVQGAAKGMTTAMQRDGFTALPPTNAIETVIAPPITVSRVLFAAGFDAAARDVAAYLGVATIEPLLDPSPVGPDSAGAQIVIALGTDLAGKIPPGATPTVATGVDAITLPPVAGSPNETTTTAAA